jgi:hypothetical protein
MQVCNLFATIRLFLRHDSFNEIQRTAKKHSFFQSNHLSINLWNNDSVPREDLHGIAGKSIDGVHGE